MTRGVMGKYGEIWKQTHKPTGRTSCADESRDQEMHFQTNKHQRLPTNHEKLGEGHGTNFPSQLSEETNPADTLISDFQPPKL